jgi:hypothetical protein
MPWSFIIPAAASLLGGSMQADAASDASAASNAQSQAALDLQRKMYEESVARQQPFLQTGTEFFNKLAQLHRDPSGGNAMMQMDPGYGFRLSEGLKGLDRQAAARGGLISGSALKAAQRYGQDYASNEFGNAYNRLAQMANTGPRAAGVLSDLGTNFANSATGIYNQMGTNTGNAMLSRGSAYGNALGGAMNQAGQWYQSRQGNPYNMPNNDGSGNMPWGEGPGW